MNDKLVCINTEIDEKDLRVLGLVRFVFELNRIYFYVHKNPGDDMISMHTTDTELRVYNMNTSSYAFFPDGILEKYFIPYNVWLNKWREQQIKSILDD